MKVRMKIEMEKIGFGEAAWAVGALVGRKPQWIEEGKDYATFKDREGREWEVCNVLRSYRARILLDGTEEVTDRRYHLMLITPYLEKKDLPFLGRTLEKLYGMGARVGRCKSQALSEGGKDWSVFGTTLSRWGIAKEAENCANSADRAAGGEEPR